MTNEEKAKRITDRIFEDGFNANRTYYDMAKNAAIDIAQWKDVQFKTKIEDLFNKLENESYNDRVKSGFEIFKDELMKMLDE